MVMVLKMKLTEDSQQTGLCRFRDIAIYCKLLSTYNVCHHSVVEIQESIVMFFCLFDYLLAKYSNLVI